MEKEPFHDQAFDKAVEKAIMFVDRALSDSGRNPKPVLLHSIRVAMYLYNAHYPKDVVVAAVLHDVLEDTDIKNDEIEREFGLEVLKLVMANTHDRLMKNIYERDKEMIDRCKQCGKDALLIKAVDIFDNSPYYHYVWETREERDRLLQKNKYFLDVSSEILAYEPILDLLMDQYHGLLNSSKST
jgi:(p)ppGpp synthase/HD superfamily hydrolase